MKPDARIRMRNTLFLTLAASVLAGCGGSPQTDAQRWMETASRELRGKVDKVPEPGRFVPYAYSDTALADPFSQDKLATPVKGEKPAPVTDHLKTVLESFPLESLQYVGVIEQRGTPVALVKNGASVFRTQVGGYIGQDYGRIIAINESEVTVRELVRDPGGDWVERTSRLQLQTAPKS
jgi:type IV pilus assembly protein PilP